MAREANSAPIERIRAVYRKAAPIAKKQVDARVYVLISWPVSVEGEYPLGVTDTLVDTSILELANHYGQKSLTFTGGAE